MSKELMTSASKVGLSQDWVQTLLDRFGPAMVQALLAFLGNLQHPSMQATAKVGCSKEAVDCIDQCIQAQFECLQKCCEKRCCVETTK